MGEAPSNRTDEHDLRAVTPRLTDLQRKCRSVGLKSLEAEEMEERIQSILERLQFGEDGDAEQPPFAALARELFAVERFFESNGFLSIAKEVAHVERTLESFASADEPGPLVASAALKDVDPDDRPETDVDECEIAPPEGPSRWAIPKPLAAVMVVSLVAVAVCVAIIVRHENPPPTPVEPPVSEPSPVPTTRPSIPTPIRIGADTSPAPGAILAEEVGQARIALREGDIETAIQHLSQAALVDADHATVLATARQIVDLLVDRAESAADGGLWEIADLTLTRAQRIATRFNLETRRIEDAAYRHSQLDRFALIQPTDLIAIRAAGEKRVTIFFKNGSTRESIIKGAEEGNLLLDEDSTVRGGTVYYVEKVPLAEIDYLQVWEK